MTRKSLGRTQYATDVDNFMDADDGGYDEDENDPDRLLAVSDDCNCVV